MSLLDRSPAGSFAVSTFVSIIRTGNLEINAEYANVYDSNRAPVYCIKSEYDKIWQDEEVFDSQQISGD